MEHIDISNKSLAAQEAEIYRFVIRITDLTGQKTKEFPHMM